MTQGSVDTVAHHCALGSMVRRAFGPERFWILDALRVPAAVAIVTFHAILTIEANGAGLSNLPGIKWFRHLGELGVLFFFFVSGFVIHYGTMRKGGEVGRWFQWLRRRIGRLYPTYLFALVFSIGFNVGLEMLRGRDYSELLPTVTDLLTHLALVHPFLPETFSSIVPAFWFIGVLTHLIFLYPVFLFLSRHLGGGYALATVALISIVFRLLGNAVGQDTGIGYVLVMNAPARWFEWCCGAYVAQLVVESKPPALRIALGSVFVLAALALHGTPLEVVAPAIGAVFMIWIIWGALLVTASAVPPGIIGCLEPLGPLTYGVYLLHMPLLSRIAAALKRFNLDPLAYLVSCVVLCSCLTFLLAWVAEKFIVQSRTQIRKFVSARSGRMSTNHATDMQG